MISKQKLRSTVVCYWSADDESFIAESSLMPDVFIGVGDTADEALKTFDSALDATYKEIEADNVAGYSKGRPAKGYVAFNTNIRPNSRATILEMSNGMDISQGEVVDYLVFFHSKKRDEQIHKCAENQMQAAIDAINGKIDQLLTSSGQIVNLVSHSILSGNAAAMQPATTGNVLLLQKTPNYARSI